MFRIFRDNCEHDKYSSKFGELVSSQNDSMSYSGAALQNYFIEHNSLNVDQLFDQVGKIVIDHGDYEDEFDGIDPAMRFQPGPAAGGMIW